MKAASSPAPGPATAPAPPHLLTTWPHAAQLATAFFAGAATVLLFLSVSNQLVTATRPSDLQPRPAAVVPPRSNPQEDKPTQQGTAQSPATASPPAFPLASKLSEGEGTVDVNHATAEELQKLPGIGPKLSQRIIDERKVKPFANAEDLRRVSGIGAKTVEKLRPLVRFGPISPPVAKAE